MPFFVSSDLRLKEMLLEAGLTTAFVQPHPSADRKWYNRSFPIRVTNRANYESFDISNVGHLPNSSLLLVSSFI
jgi:hypothetical protein